MAIEKLQIQILERPRIQFTDAISTTQFLGEILAKLSEVIDQVNNIENAWEVDISTAINSYNVVVVGMIEDVKSYSDEKNDILSTYLLGIIEDNLESVLAIVNLQNSNISQIQQGLTNLQNYVDSVRNYLLSYVDQQITIVRGEVAQDVNEINERIDHIINEYPPVYNPTTGLYEGLEKVLQDMYTALAYNSVTALEFDLLRMTATQFDSMQLTAIEYDINAKQFLGFFDEKFYMTNPFTGEYVNYKIVINDIIDKIRTGSFTAAEYDAEQFTVTVFEGYEISAIDFDTSGKQIMI